MSSNDWFRLAEQTRRAVDQLAEHATTTTYAELPGNIRERLTLMLTDLVGVTIAGSRTPEITALSAQWGEPDTFLAATAACMLELDEGNKYAAGHPAAHVFFAALDACQPETSAEDLLAAVAAGYEVAARFGAATRTNPGWHTHGHWGATGAACASALLKGGDRDQVAAAIDAAGALMQVTPWDVVLAGDFTRNMWIAGANAAGTHAARLAMAGLVHNHGAVAASLGGLMGSLDPERLTSGLGTDWLVAQGYLKRHSACSYTHPAVDLIEALSPRWQVPSDDIARVRIRTHSLAEPLFARHPVNRLSAMFSLPFVAAMAIINGAVTPGVMDPDSEQFALAEEFSERIDVAVDPVLDSYLPSKRITEIEVELSSGEILQAGQANPIGDVAHFPLQAADVHAKLTALIGEEDTTRIEHTIKSLTAPEISHPTPTITPTGTAAPLLKLLTTLWGP